MGHILTVALNAAIDTTLTVLSSLTLGESHRAGDVLKLPGGKGVNVARVLHTIGVPVHVTGECTSITAAAADAGIAVQALILAVACGAANTLCLGAGILKREDVERLSSMVDVTVLERCPSF
jgi:fructose-1-phosphate kinase PfkB-like protein